MTTPRDLIHTARHVIVDADTNTPRQADEELLGYFNDGMKELSGIRTELFTSIGDYTCSSSTAEQAITFLDAQLMIEVLSIHGGSEVTAIDVAQLAAYKPNWRNSTPGAAKHWAKYEGQPLKFFIYPPAPATAQVLDVKYVRNPVVLGLDDIITELPVTYHPALVDYIIYRTESKDDEHVLSERALMHRKSFEDKVKGN